MMEEAKGGEGERQAKVAVHRQTNELSLQDSDEELLPGLPDEITLDHIVPKLPWAAGRVLASVSRLWCQAIRSRSVHDARVRANSTEELVVVVRNLTCPNAQGKIVTVNSDHDDENLISLFSARDGSWLQLPRCCPKAHDAKKGFPDECQCVSLDGKIYVLGGWKRYGDTDDDDESDSSEYDDSDSSEVSDDNEDADKKGCDDDHPVKRTNEVYVLDVAGHGRWEQCASMPQARSFFGCGVLDGKIYVFGGVSSSNKAARESFVFDPKENAWSSVRPMKRKRVEHRVVAVGEELFVHSGRFHGNYRVDTVLCTEVYHPGRDEWRSLEPFGCHRLEILFNAKGKLHMMTPLGIYGHDGVDRDGQYSWTLQQSFAYVDESLEAQPFVCAVEDVNDELLGLLTFSGDGPTGLFQSKGFGSEKEELLWDKIPSEVFLFSEYIHFMCPIQL